MKFFIDTSNTKEIRDAFEMGIISGVTTNPTVISKSGKDFKTTIKEITDIIGKDGIIFAEATALESQEMIKEGREIAKLHTNVVVKLPMIKEGIKALSVLAKDGIATCATLCFSAPQALVASLAGAKYVAPFIGRNTDIGWDGMSLIDDITTMYQAQDIDTQLVMASVRTGREIVLGAQMGAHIATMSHKLMMSLLTNPSTELTLAQFLKDWEKVPK